MKYIYFKINIKMEAINYIKKYHKPYIGKIDNNVYDDDGYNYMYYHNLYNPITQFLINNYDKHIKKLNITKLFKKYQMENDINDIINFNNEELKENIHILITNYFDSLETIYESYYSLYDIKQDYLIILYIDNNNINNINVNLPVRIVENKNKNKIIKIKNISCYWIHSINSTFYNLTINMINYDNRYIDNGNLINNCHIKNLIIKNCDDSININNSYIEELNVEKYYTIKEFPNEKINIKNSNIDIFKLKNCNLKYLQHIKNNQINFLNLFDNYNQTKYNKINNNNNIKNLIFNNNNFDLHKLNLNLNLNLNLLNGKKVIVINNKTFNKENFNKENYKSIQINNNMFYYNENEFIIINK